MAWLDDYCNKPCAVAGLISYRYRGRYGWIMIGAKDTADALREAARSTDNVSIVNLEVWGELGYAPVREKPYPMCTGAPTVEDCAKRGYCAREHACND